MLPFSRALRKMLFLVGRFMCLALVPSCVLVLISTGDENSSNGRRISVGLYPGQKKRYKALMDRREAVSLAYLQRLLHLDPASDLL